jgi:membrane peptidoglycan carboxypeptidase
MRKKQRLAAMSRGKRIARRFALIGTWALALLAAVMVAAVLMFYSFTRVPEPSDLKVDQVASVLYSNGKLMARVGTVNRTIVPLSQVPQHVRWAVIAAEDRGFYSEPGVSMRGTVRAALSDLRGHDSQGGSGITQQYVKNAYLNSERTLSRKLRELAIAVKLDRHYSKDQILAWYLNTIYFGRGAYGIQAAAEAYFGVPVSKLTVSQGALLAGLIQAPSYYEPRTNPGAAEARWNYVLDGMVAIHHLVPGTRAAEKYPKTIVPPTSQLGATGPEALIVTQVKAELQRLGISEAELSARGLQVRTTIDQSAQRDAENAIKAVYSGLTAKQKKDKLRKALVAINPSTGGVLAYYGGSNGTGYDYAQAWRAPGSSFKPFTLAAALKANLAGDKPAFALNSMIDGSQPAKLPGLPPIVNDPGDAGYSHMISVQQAMTVSLNTAFARMAYAVGPDKVAAAAHAAGVPKQKTASAGAAAGQPTLQRNGGTDATIGYGSYPIRPIDQALAMSTFANGGVYHASHFVQKVTDSSGKVIYQQENSGKRAFDAKVANDVAVSMKDVASWSLDPLAGGRPSAAKTGTVGLTGVNAGNSDAWMVGFTPQVSAAVWTGNDQTSVPVLNKAGGPLYGRDMPGRAWQLFMDAYLAHKAIEPMPTQQKIMHGTNQSASSSPKRSQPPTSRPAPPPSSPSSPSTPSSPPPSSPSTPSSPPPSSPSSPPPATSTSASSGKG